MNIKGLIQKNLFEDEENSFHNFLHKIKRNKIGTITQKTVCFL